MKTMTVLTLGLLGALLSPPLAQGQAAPAAVPAYVDENQPDPAPLKLDEVTGKVQGLGGDAMPRAIVSLFTEDGHALISTMMTNKDGKFRFDRVGKGFYRVVARVEGLCTANIPVKVESSLLHRKLVITMQPKDLDKCSYGMLTKK